MDAASPPNDLVGLLTLNSTTYKLTRAPDPLNAGLAGGTGSPGNIISFDCGGIGAPYPDAYTLERARTCAALVHLGT